MGYIMELMMGAGGEQNAQSNMYMYFKVGCPIAWIGGLLKHAAALLVDEFVSARVALSMAAVMPTRLERSDSEAISPAGSSFPELMRSPVLSR